MQGAITPQKLQTWQAQAAQLVSEIAQNINANNITDGADPAKRGR